jgi:hypothetical protein
MVFVQAGLDPDPLTYVSLRAGVIDVNHDSWLIC